MAAAEAAEVPVKPAAGPLQLCCAYDKRPLHGNSMQLQALCRRYRGLSLPCRAFVALRNMMSSTISKKQALIQ